MHMDRSTPKAQTLTFWFIFQQTAKLYYSTKEDTIHLAVDTGIKIIIWKARGVPQLNDVAHPKHPEEEETSPNRNHIITGKQQQTN